MDGGNVQQNGSTTNEGAGQQQTGQSAGSFDYEKLASIISGKQSVAEEQVLKGYFKQQGLSKEEMDQAIAAYKQQQKEKEPDIVALQNTAATASKKAADAVLESKATMAAVLLGIDVKTIPYVLKLADFSQAVGQDGAVNEETIKNALNKVLEDIPALKAPQAQSGGFMQVGTNGSGSQTTATDAELDRIFGVKK